MDEILLSPSDSFVIIAIIFIIAQLFYLSQKLLVARQLTGRFTRRRLRASFKPRGWAQRIFQWFVLLVVVRDILHFFFARNGLPLPSLLFAIVMVLFVLTASMDRYQEYGTTSFNQATT
jgi:ABC-type xylose transport system permease subunit